VNAARKSEICSERRLGFNERRLKSRRLAKKSRNRFNRLARRLVVARKLRRLRRLVKSENMKKLVNR